MFALQTIRLHLRAHVIIFFIRALDHQQTCLNGTHNQPLCIYSRLPFVQDIAGNLIGSRTHIPNCHVPPFAGGPIRLAGDYPAHWHRERL